MNISCPNPQFARNSIIDLNGMWSCRFDTGKSGAESSWEKSVGFETPIKVPYCPESTLSGIQHTDFIECMWYHRTFSVPADWQNRKILLRFGGVDYKCRIFIDGAEAGAHTGGVSPFSIDITSFVQPEKEHHLVLEVHDELKSHIQPFGKQSPWLNSQRCSYTRTTGIWGNVYLESCDHCGLERCRIVPDLDNGAFYFTPEFYASCSGNRFQIDIYDGEKLCASVQTGAVSGVPVTVKLDSPKVWSPDSPFLYDVKFRVMNGSGESVDTVNSYAGLRKFHIEKDRFYLNNKPIFLRMVLDQGFYGDGIWTAPDEEALEKDIRLALAAGFNGARLHQKIFDPRYHYHADRLGFLTFGEFPDWGIGFWKHFTDKDNNFYHSFRDYYAQWCEVLQRDFNHPSIIGWTPFNETRFYSDWGEHCRILSDIYDLTRQLDPTRVICDSSGYTHVKTDIWSVHLYYQEPSSLAEKLAAEPVPAFEPEKELRAYCGQPYFVGEYGGCRYVPEGKEWQKGSWGYGGGTLSKDEALTRMQKQTEAIIAAGCAGYCYTQLTDVEQEQNGVYCYDRSEKYSAEELLRIFGQKPEWSSY